MSLVCAIIGVPISYISSHLSFNKTVEPNYIVTVPTILYYSGPVLILLLKYIIMDRMLYTEQSFITKSPNFQDRCLLGYKCAHGVKIFYYIFLDTFSHLFNVESGTINVAINTNLYAFDGELNSTPFHSAQIFKLGFVYATIELQISFVY